MCTASRRLAIWGPFILMWRSWSLVLCSRGGRWRAERGVGCRLAFPDGRSVVRLLREQPRPADLRILPGRRHVTTTTRFTDPTDPVANLVAAFVRDPTAVVGTPESYVKGGKEASVHAVSCMPV